MTDLELLRIGREDDGLTQGVLLKDGIAFAVTLERPWRENEPDVSCIPAGTYTCMRYHSEKYKNTFEITGVPGRTKILFHRGNEIPDTLGCVLVGEKYVDLGIGESGLGFDEFLSKFKDRDSFILSVIDVGKYLPTA
jgi:uncharacterized protein DUF5675